jgi:broad specificity phosphatase PhoE
METMSTRLLLVRHGQASIDATDYDQLSALGHAQCAALGHYLRQHHESPCATAVHGRLRRHQQSYAALAQGAGHAQPAHTEADFDEYDFRGVLTAYLNTQAHDPQALEAATHGGRAWLRHLRPALTAWALAKLELPPAHLHAQFQERVSAALARVATAPGPVLIVTSGGVIGAAVGHALGLTATDAVRLNLCIENSSVTELDFEHGRLHLVRFNSVAHLDDPTQRSLV